MRPQPRRAVLLTSIVALFAVAARGQITPELAAGYKAGIVCSAVFHAGRALADIERDELGGDPLQAGAGAATLDRERRAVAVAYEGGAVPRLAVFIDGLGTVILPPGAT